MRGTRGADHWLVKGCVFFDTTLREVITSLEGGSCPLGLETRGRQRPSSIKARLKDVWNCFKKARRAMEIMALDVMIKDEGQDVGCQLLC
jgi:hypothetical protein